MAGTDSVLNLKINTIMDVSDVKHNVDEIQKSFGKLKLPDKLGDNLKKNISDFNKEYEKYQKKVVEGIHTQGDKNAVNKSLNSMLNSYEKIINEFSKMSKKDFKDIFNLDTGAFEKVQAKIKQIQNEIKKIKLDPKGIIEPINQIKKLTSAKSLFGEGKGLNKLTEAFRTNDLLKAKEAIKEVDNYLAKFGSRMKPENLTAFKAAFDPLRQKVLEADKAAEGLFVDLDKVNAELNEAGAKGSREFQGIAEDLDRTKASAASLTEELKRQHEQEFNFNNEVKNIDRQIQSYFGLSQIIRKVGNIARDAFSTVKELDAAMVETAVVTNFDVGDMWDMLPMYTENANALGSTIKDVYEAATLYYQQGLNQAQAMGLARETLKMARIGGLEAAEATDMMTAALRGFNMQINELSAQRINDVYSELAAITASNTKEIGSAMERTASIANSANMEFETTSAFLAQMIETTREAPENLGTAMKTIIARFQEMKQDPTKLIDSEGVMMDANRVDKALKTIGVDLMNQKGEFRDLDDVFLDIAAKWDSLTQGQQRYIATIAAGSRQQSRFIAMMSNYDRTMELVEAANNSAGASQRQFEKTLEGMDAKLNKLKNAWNQFAMGLMNNQIIKFGVDALTKALDVVNKIIDTIGKISPKPFEGITKSVLTLVATFAGLNLAKTGLTGLIQGGVGWWKNETGKGLIGSIAGAVKDQSKTGINSQQLGKKDGKIYGQFWKLSVNQEIAKQDAIKRAQPKDFLNFKQAFGNISSNMTKGMGPQLEANIRKTFENAFTQVNSNIIGEKEGQELINGYIEKIRAGELSVREAMEQLNQKVVGRGGQAIDTGQVLTPILKQSEPQFGKISGTINKFGSATTNAGNALVDLGVALSTIHPALAPLGTTLTTIGTLMASLGSTITLVVGKFAQAGGGMAGLAAIWTLPLVKVIAVVSALIIAYKVLDKLIITNKERLEAASDAAAAASDAYSSAKQETSELADNINRIKEADAGFDNLVAGTAAFNEQLIEANQLILDLINKYPMLNDYLTIDKNGRMQISEEGFKAVTDYQKQIQSRAAALNTQKNAELEAEKTRQELDRLTKTTTYTGPNDRPIEVQKTLTEEEQKQADLLQKQYDTQKQSAALNAARTTISSQELANQEAIAGLYASQYESLKEAVNVSGNKEDNYRKYAEYYGYSYEGGKLLDVEGNEVNVDYDTIKSQIPDITVMMNFEANAASIDSAITTVNELFKDNLDGKFEGSDTFISDILSNNIEANEDLIQQILTDDEDLVNAVQEMSAENLATILNVDKETIKNNLNTYQQQLIDLIHNNATNIADAQAQEYADLAAMIGEAQYGSDFFARRGRDARTIVEDGKKVQEDITKQIKSLNASQRRSILRAGQALQESAGKDSMKIIVNGMKGIYNEVNTATGQALNEANAAANEMQDIVDNINWSSATDRLAGYKQMVQSTSKDVQDLGNDLLNSSDSANLLGEAFEEVYDSTDFQEVLENLDDYVDASGNVDASGIIEMAKESRSLNELLDTGAITAGGFALAFNTLHGAGDVTLLNLNQDVLTLLSSFAQLDSVMASAHSTVENFDAGIDTGEGEDFIRDAVEKYNELRDNGEWGNPQMEAYAKLIVGEDRWLTALQKNNGDLEKTFDQFNSKIQLFSDGYYDAWSKLADNEKLDPSGIVSWGENGEINLKVDDMSTDEVVEYLQENLKISKEAAELMLTDFENYSADLRAELQATDFIKGFKETDYIENRTGADGQIILTLSEIQTISTALGKTEEEVKEQIAEAAGITKEQLGIIKNIDDKGNLVTDWDELAKEVSKKNIGSDASQYDWVKTYQKDGAYQVKEAIEGLKSDGLVDEQSLHVAYEAFKELGEDQRFEYEGQLLKPEDIKSYEDFVSAIEEFSENSQWKNVGEAIAEGYVGYIANHDSNGDGIPDNGGDIVPGGYSSENSTSGSSSKGGNKNNTPTYGTSQTTRTQAQSAVEEGKVFRGGQGVGESKEAIEAEKKATEATEKLEQTINGVTVVSADQKLGDYSGDSTKMYGHASEDTRQTQRYLMEHPDEDPAEIRRQMKYAQDKVYNQYKLILDENGEEILIPNDAAYALKKNYEKSFKYQAEQTKKIMQEAAKKNFTPQKVTPDSKEAYGLHTTTNQPTIANQGLHDQTWEQVTGGHGAGEIEINVDTKAIDGAKKYLDAFFNYADEESKKKRVLGIEINDINRGPIEAVNRYIYGLHPKINVGTEDEATSAAIGIAAGIDNMRATIEVGLFDNFTSKVNEIVNAARQKTVHIPVNAQTAYTGVNNKISSTHVPMAGSLAGGTKKGKVGPKNQGGLTLTGEEGYEIGWIPSESRSFILGANGPQMVNLPKEAVVYNHEQSEDILKNKKGIQAGSLGKGRVSSGYGGRNNSNSSSGKGKKNQGSSGNSGNGGNNGNGGGNGNDNDQPKSITYNNFSLEEIYRFEVEGKIKNYQSKIDKWGKKFNKLIDKIGTRVSDVSTSLKKQRDNLKKIVDENKNLEDSYIKDLNTLADGSYKTKISYTPNEGSESKDETVNLSKYVTHKKGKYGISKKAIERDSEGDPAKAEALYKAAEGALNPLLSGLENARNAAETAQDNLDDLDQQVYETFYGWKNELTKIFDLTQKINTYSLQIDRFNSQVNLELARLGAGYSTITQSYNRSIEALDRANKSTEKKIEETYNLIEANREKVQETTHSSDEWQRYQELKKDPKADPGAVKAAKDEYNAAKLARKYMNVSYNKDGTANIEVDWKKFEKDNEKDRYNTKTAEAIKEKIDEAIAANDDLNQNITDETDLIAGVYEQMQEYFQTVVDWEKTLVEGLKKQLQTEVDNAKTLNSSITNSLKNILDTVRNKLNERRQAEDNAKTANEISQKQQRLAYLKANTAGGNQLEIAQLEQELAGSKQAYERTLEDQLLTNIQNQNDAAAQQRERQIEIAQAQVDLATQQLNKKVDMWLNDPQAYQTEIYNAWKSSQEDYDELGEYGKKALQDQFNKDFTTLSTAVTQLKPGNPNGKKITTIKDTVNKLEGEGKNAGSTLNSILQNINKSNTSKGGEKKKTEPKKSDGKKKTETKKKETPKKKETKPATSKKQKLTNDIIKGIASAIWIWGSEPSGWGYGDARIKNIDKIFGSGSGKKVQDFINKHAATDSGWTDWDTAKKYFKNKFKTGGMASFTGPAWLDGTKAKPELVLNSTDTKNFVQLKDVLSSVMRGGALENEPIVTGDTNIEVNINVDHIANDYDVDKIANRVKKIIVKDSSYRNVTAVRKFR